MTDGEGNRMARPRLYSYHCPVCNWQGRRAPEDFGRTAACPQCGTYMHPLNWLQTWGFAFFLMAASVGLVFAIRFAWR